MDGIRSKRREHHVLFRLFAFFTCAAIYMAFVSHAKTDMGGTFAYVGATIISATVTLMQWVERTRLDNILEQLKSEPLLLTYEEDAHA